MDQKTEKTLTLKDAEKFLTPTEVKRLEMIAKCDTIKNAAHKLGIAEGTLYNWIQSLKHKYRHYRGWINTMESLRRHNPDIARIFHERQPITPTLEDSEEEEWQDLR
jgi:hypothetical protein